MRRLQHLPVAAVPLVPDAPPHRRDATLQAWFHDAKSVERPMPCLRCPEAECHSAAMPGQSRGPVCPVGALRPPQGAEGAVVGPDCIGCGICALRCPVGAISVTSGKASVGAAPGQPGLSLAAPGAFADWMAELAPLAAPASARKALVAQFTHAASALKGEHYYPLVRQLFMLLGVDAELSHQGDTSWRVDLLLPSPERALPVEIKSATETPAINVKSVQQALENKLVLARRLGAESLDDASSLVVGHAYPPKRSGVTELIRDIKSAYGVRIGLISLGRLYALALEGKPLDRGRLERLEGEL